MFSSSKRFARDVLAVLVAIVVYDLMIEAKNELKERISDEIMRRALERLTGGQNIVAHYVTGGFTHDGTTHGPEV